MKQFSDFRLNKQLLRAIEEIGYTDPTPIQEKGLPIALAGTDLLGIAQTGTGKTATYVLPILMKTLYHQPNGPRAVIFAPTRELAVQIHSVVEQLSQFTDLKTVVTVGGKAITKQIEDIEAGLDILIATPGRFMELYLKGNLYTKNLKILVLDEADRMMDMGFMPQIRKILEIIPVKRQNLLFSATMSAKVEELSHEFLDFPEKVEITPQATAVETVTQEVYRVPNLRTKINFLEYLLNSEETAIERGIIFTRKRSTAESVYKFIDRKNLATTRVIHANKGQNARINAMDEFKEGSIRILVTTDVSARGIDVEDVSHVINFDVPVMYEEYVHRIGRTGRARKEGKAITFCNPAEEYHIKKIEKLIREPIPLKMMPDAVAVEKTGFEEKQQIDREIDHQKKKEDPNYKGAFHEKKKKFKAEPKQKGKKKRRR